MLDIENAVYIPQDHPDKLGNPSPPKYTLLEQYESHQEKYCCGDKNTM
jgi:hypothetical protein